RACSRWVAQRPQNFGRYFYFVSAAHSSASKLARHRGFTYPGHPQSASIVIGYFTGEKMGDLVVALFLRNADCAEDVRLAE
ncbi:hypothetical protein, partial [Pseudomonas prosekii]|uniref:hypothetical protein n=1 Tax=Pseudomonas prosekii TaxID=1148509 RepID=UPI001C7D7B5F